MNLKQALEEIRRNQVTIQYLQLKLRRLEGEE